MLTWKRRRNPIRHSADGDNAMPGLEAPVWFRRFPILRRRGPRVGPGCGRQAQPGQSGRRRIGGRYRDEDEATKYKFRVTVPAVVLTEVVPEVPSLV